MITFDATKLEKILETKNSRIEICGKTFESLKWNDQHVMSVLCGVRAKEVTNIEIFFPIKLLTPRARILVKIAQSNFLPQGCHFHTVRMEILLLIYAILICIDTELPNLILHFMLKPSEQLAFSCLLTKVFTHFKINLSNETSTLGKEGIGSFTINIMFLPRNDLNRSLEGETKEQGETRVKKS